jgi:hypothetical protein
LEGGLLFSLSLLAELAGKSKNSKIDEKVRI